MVASDAGTLSGRHAPGGAVPGGQLVRGLSLLGVVALIAGNMMGTSIYTLPASLAASVGPLALLAWLLTAAGYFFVARVYAGLGARYPRSGGPYVFARHAFGDFAAFQVSWAYWISSVIGNAAIVTGVVGYVVGYWPAFAANPWLQFAIAQCFLWGLCWLNIRGVRQSSVFQTAIVLLTVIPLVLVALLSLRHFDASNLRPFAPHGWSSISVGAALVVWAYSGIESATVPAEEVVAPEATIQRGTMLGYLVGTFVFLLVALAVSGAVPTATLATSTRPIALTAERTVGPLAAQIVAIAAMVAGLGTLNGWTLMMGRIPLGAAQDGLFPSALARIHPRYGTPYVAILVGTTISALACSLYFVKTLLAAFQFIVLLSVLTTLVPHLYAAAAALHEARTRHEAAPVGAWSALMAFFFVLYTMYGVGPEVAMWGLLTVLAGIPLFVVLRTPSPPRP